MKDISFLLKKPIAHRGVHENVPENSLASFKKAIEKGYPIELDVQLTKDNTLVVFHDSSMQRLTGINKKIGTTDYSEIKKITLNKSRQNIPTLKETLEVIKGKVPVIIELKGNSKNHLLENKVASLLDNYKGIFAVKSFDGSIIRWFYKNRPDYVRGILISSHRKISNIQLYFLIRKTNPDFISCNYQLNGKRVIRWQKKRPVLGWTIRNMDDYLKYKDKFDSLIVDFK